MNKSNLILAALLLCIGVLAGMIFQGNSQSSPGSGSDENVKLAVYDAKPAATQKPAGAADTSESEPDIVAADIEQLAQQLVQERKKRKDLEMKVQQLGEQVEKLSQHLITTRDEGNDDRNDKTISTGSRNIPQRISGWVDAKRLSEAGLTSEQADNITQVYESVEMDKLYLRDRAQREGWMASQRVRDEMDKLDERTRNLRNELGEQAYDALLYATGRPNRVIVEGTLGNSPAAQAGIKKGDAILRYADKPIYSWYDLRSATTEGDANDMVAVQIARGNKRMEIYVKRGPLGIRLDQESVNPAP